MAISDVDVCNRALQKLGAKRITSLTENSPNARDCNAAYEILRDAELRKHPWSFARKRASLAADGTDPAFGYDKRYALPTDFLRLTEENSNELRTQYPDLQIEGRYILTDNDAPLQVVYIATVSDPNEFDALFVEALASKIAYELCEKITQSNTKKAAAGADYRDAIREAKRTNAIERPSLEPPEDTWVTARI